MLVATYIKTYMSQSCQTCELVMRISEMSVWGCRCCRTLGGDTASGDDAHQPLLIGSCNVVAECQRAPVDLSPASGSASKPRHCDVIATSRESLLMTSLGQDVIYVIQSGTGLSSVLISTPG